jgi:hypothetical protein
MRKPLEKPTALKMSRHSERSEESRSAFSGIPEERTGARFLAPLGMTRSFHGFWVPPAAWGTAYCLLPITEGFLKRQYPSMFVSKLADSDAEARVWGSRNDVGQYD